MTRYKGTKSEEIIIDKRAREVVKYSTKLKNVGFTKKIITKEIGQILKVKDVALSYAMMRALKNHITQPYFTAKINHLIFNKYKRYMIKKKII